MAKRADEASEGREKWPKLCCKGTEIRVEQDTMNVATETESSYLREGDNQEDSIRDFFAY